MHVLDAPVSGGPRGAKTRKLAIWVGGDRAVFDQHQARCSTRWAISRYYVGPIGAGAVAKLVHNCASFAIRAVLAEVFSHGRQGRRRAARAVAGGAAGRERTRAHLRPARATSSCRAPTTRPSFALKLGHKDVSLATELGRELGVPMRLANLALAELTEALNRGWGDKDSSSYMLLEAERAGVEFSVPRTSSARSSTRTRAVSARVLNQRVGEEP